MNTISIYTVEPKAKSYTHIVKKALARSLRILKKDNVALEVYFVDNKAIHFLNKKYRDKDKTTNVLSFIEPKYFPHPELRRGSTQIARGLTQIKKRIKGKSMTHLGEVYLAIPYIKEEARTRTTPYPVLFTEYSIHGLLHLLGYKHSAKSDRIQMEKLEKFLISNI